MRRLSHLTLILTCALLVGNTPRAWGQARPRATTPEQMRLNAIQDVRNKLEPQLARYCGETCELVGVDVDVIEAVDETTELGFESVVGQAALPRLVVNNVTVNIQIDDNITTVNRERLRSILLNHLRDLAVHSEILWRPVSIPNINQASGSAVALQRQAESQLEQAILKTIQTYCPNQCLLSYIGVQGKIINSDEAESLPRNQVVRDASNRSFLRIDQANIDVSMDENLDDSVREKILSMMRMNTRFFSPVSINLSVSQFPESVSEQLKKQANDDPYGLEKLRQMLIMFRELAGTKEIISSATNQSESKAEKHSSSEATESSSSKSTEINATNSKETNQSKSATVDSKEAYSENDEVNWLMWGSVAFVGLLALYLFMRFTAANRDAKIMMSNMPGEMGQSGRAGAMGSESGGMQSSRIGGYDEAGRPIYVDERMVVAKTKSSIDTKAIADSLKVEELKEQLVSQLMAEPKIAKDTFSRMIKEEGVELTSRYLHILGNVVILHLVDDQNFSRDLYALGEFFQKTKLEINKDEELKLLYALRNRMTASEIRVRSSKGLEKFSFLETLDPPQIFALVSEEKPQVQSIVLTQLDKKRRMAVFDMYQGDAKVLLMNELCRADAIPKEYLSNVARALHRKVDARPEFDTENIRSSEIIIDLMERSSLNDQRQIMSHLKRTHPDTARGIMMKLVTLEILPYLKDGHLLELILGMDHRDLITFLAGTPEHIRNLFLTKAPYELAESWLEELNNQGPAEESAYKLVELQVFNKIRNLANSGIIKILDINEMIYSWDGQQQQTIGRMSRSAMAA